MKRSLRTLTRISLIFIYLVILAGSIVRMTGSGMGCPDWPKCFGYLIPPTERSQLEWQPQREFKKGQIIIVNESLKVAKQNFTTGDRYAEEKWADYTRHDYAQFNPFHTWTEYINRLTGALSGIPVLLLVIFSLSHIRTDWRPFALSLATMLMLGFEAWLGKLVVDGNLIPGSITIHMMGALLIITLLCLLLGITSTVKTTTTPYFRTLLIFALILTLIQTVLGTQVREQVDLLNKEGIMRTSWVSHFDWEFYVHRSLSILILGLNVYLWWMSKKYSVVRRELNLILILIGLEILLGILLNYTGMPKFAQPLHLLLATFIFGLQFYAIVKTGNSHSLKTINDIKQG